MATDGSFPLYIAAQHGHFSIVELLLKNMADINKTVAGVPTLYIAIKNRHIDIVKLLLENGADVNFPIKGAMPLDFAIQNNIPEVVDLLLAYKGKFGALLNNQSPFLYAIRNEQEAMVKVLLKHHYDYKIITSLSSPMLLQIAGLKNCDKQIKNYLRKQFRDIPAQTHLSLLQLATLFGNLNIMKMLIHAGATHSADEQIPLSTLTNSQEILKFLEEMNKNAVHTAQQSILLPSPIQKNKLLAASQIEKLTYDSNENTLTNHVQKPCSI